MEENICTIVSTDFDRIESLVEIPPYYRSIQASVTVEPIPEFDTFYYPYRIFCLKSRLEPLIYKQFGPCYEPMFVTKYKPEVDRMQLSLQILRQGIVVPISEEQKDNLEKAVQIITSRYIDHCLLFDAGADLTIRGITMPSSWLTSLLPYLYDDLMNELGLQQFEPLLDDGAIYIKWPHFTIERIPIDSTMEQRDKYSKIGSFEDRHFDTLGNLINIFLDLYERGTIVCSRDFCEQWNLEILVEKNYEQQMDDEKPTQIVVGKALWYDSRVSTYLTEFLLDPSSVKVYPFVPFRDEKVQKHFISLFLTKKKVPYIIAIDHITIFPTDSEELIELVRGIWEAKSASYGSVYVQPLKTIANIDTLKNLILREALEEEEVSFYKDELNTIYLSLWSREASQEAIEKWRAWLSTVPLKVEF